MMRLSDQGGMVPLCSLSLREREQRESPRTAISKTRSRAVSTYGARLRSQAPLTPALSRRERETEHHRRPGTSA